jgi:hypothetical protein
MSKAHDDFAAAFDRLLDQVGIADAMSIATTIFVSLVVGYIAHKGEDTNKENKIDGGEQRDITIHAPKGAHERQCDTSPVKWRAHCPKCGQVEIIQKTQPKSCKTVIRVGIASTRRCGMPLEQQRKAVA